MQHMVLIGCPTCGRRYRYDAQRFGASGVRIRCRTCEAVMRVDIPDGLRAAPAGSEATRPQPAAAGSTPQPAAAGSTSQSAATPAPAPVAEVADGPPTALVADRNPELRAYMAGCLRSHGFEIIEVDDGMAVRRALGQRRPALLILNAFLPGVLGVTLCAEVKRHPQLAAIPVLLVGSLYRRDRFMRDPEDLYGADGFLDGNGSRDELRKQITDFVGRRSQRPEPAAEADSEIDALRRLARTVVGDVILYNPDSAERELAAGRFFEAFAHELREGEQMAVERFPGIEEPRACYRNAVREAVSRHREAAGMPAVAER